MVRRAFPGMRFDLVDIAPALAAHLAFVRVLSEGELPRGVVRAVVLGRAGELYEVRFEDALKDDVYDHLRDLSRIFREGIQRLFFDEHPELSKLIRNFGVF